MNFIEYFIFIFFSSKVFFWVPKVICRINNGKISISIFNICINHHVGDGGLLSLKIFINEFLSFCQNVGACRMNSISSSFLIQPRSLLTNVITALLSTVGSKITYSSYPFVIWNYNQYIISFKYTLKKVTVRYSCARLGIESQFEIVFPSETVFCSGFSLELRFSGV